MKKLTTLAASISLALIFGLVVAPTASAQSGFLEDYSIFDDITDEEQKRLDARYEFLTMVHITPDMDEVMSKHKAILIDQPEVWIASESPYKGLKPEAVKALADFMRQKVVDELEGDFELATEPGPGVAVVEWAMTDMYLQKKNKKWYSFTPIGFVATSATLAVINDIWKKVDMVEIKIEMALYDDTGKLMAAAIAEQGKRKDKAAGQKKRDPVSWETYDKILSNISIQLACALENSRIPEGTQKIDCEERLIKLKEE